MCKEISIIIPCFNEKTEVLKNTVEQLIESTSGEVQQFEIIIVDDGSSTYDYKLPWPESVSLLQHSENRGYGASIKTGINNAKYQWIGITDADGTYPNDKYHKLLKYTNDFDMIIGARQWSDISMIRRLPKSILTWFASFLAGFNIPDLNSGMRIFKRDLAMKFWFLYPEGFSFTSTITMAMLTHGYKIHFSEIEYYTRQGKSSIHPIKDTIRFFLLVTRLALYFNPKKFFVPLSLILFLGFLGRGIRDYLAVGSLGGLSIILFFLAIQIFFFGILAEIINKTRLYLSNNQ